MTAPFTPAQRARVNALLDNTYHAFVGNVAAARKIPLEKMPDIAKGRVWTGEQAVKIGLVDELGGYDVALSAVRKALKLEDKDRLSLENFPSPPTPAERLLKLMRRIGAESAMLFSPSATLEKARVVLGPWLKLASFANHPVAARMYPLEDVHD